MNDGARRWCFVFVWFYDWATSFIYVSGSCRCVGSTSAVNHQCFTRILTLGAIKPLNSLPLNLEGKQEEGLKTKKSRQKVFCREAGSQKQAGDIDPEKIHFWLQKSQMLNHLPNVPKGMERHPFVKPSTEPPNIGVKALLPPCAVDVPFPLNLWHKWAYQVYSQSHLKNRLELIVPKITWQNYTGKQKGNNFRQSKQHDICQVD